MSAYFAHTASSTVGHLARPRRIVYAGMTETALCGARVSVTERVASTMPGAVQPLGTCKRCAATLAQTVRQAVA